VRREIAAVRFVALNNAEMNHSFRNSFDLSRLTSDCSAANVALLVGREVGGVRGGLSGHGAGRRAVSFVLPDRGAVA